MSILVHADLFPDSRTRSAKHALPREGSSAGSRLVAIGRFVAMVVAFVMIVGGIIALKVAVHFPQFTH